MTIRFKKTFSIRALLIFTATVFVAIAIVFRYSQSVASGGRGFFSPHTLEFRTQSETLLPGTEIPLYRSQFKCREWDSELVVYLVGRGYWQPIENARPVWLLMFHSNSQWRDGHNHFYREFTRNSQDWITCSDANPELAATLWPRILNLTRDKKMTGVQLVMRYAQSSSNVEEFLLHVNSDPDLRDMGITPESF